MIPDVISRMRTSRNLQVNEFAEILGYESSYVGRLERGKRDPSLALILRLVSIADDLERRELAQELGFDDLDPLAMEVDQAMRGDSWSQQRKTAFRRTVHTLVRTSN